MDNKITISDLAEGLAKRKHITRKAAEQFIRTIFETIKDHLLEGEPVKIKGLGTFKLITVNSRESVNVHTGERIVIDSHPKITFTPEKALSDRVNRPFADFETVPLNEGTKTEDMEKIDESESEAEVEETPEVVQAPLADFVEPASEVEQPAPKVEEPTAEVVEEPIPEPVVEEVVPEPVIEEPTPESVVEEVIPEPVPEPVVEEEPKSDVAAAAFMDKQDDEPVGAEAVEKKSKKLNRWFFLLMVLLVVGLILFLLFGPKGYDGEAVEREDTTRVEQKDTIEAVPVTPAKPTKSAEELAADYPQVANGEYWIVGTKTTHVLEKGEDLSKLALEHYGDKKLINYIIRFNGYSAQKASNLFVGTEVKLPELVKKEE